MSVSDYITRVRARIGHDLLVVPSATAILRDERGRILLARHADRGVWVAPGGAIDPHETPADAVVRETWEEVGLLVEPVRVYGVYGGAEFEINYSNGDRTSYVMIAFECRVLSGVPRPDGEEVREVAWVSAEDLEALPEPDWVREVARDAALPRPEARFRRPEWQPPSEQTGLQT